MQFDIPINDFLLCLGWGSGSMTPSMVVPLICQPHLYAIHSPGPLASLFTFRMHHPSFGLPYTVPFRQQQFPLATKFSHFLVILKSQIKDHFFVKFFLAFFPMCPSQEYLLPVISYKYPSALIQIVILV